MTSSPYSLLIHIFATIVDVDALLAVAEQEVPAVLHAAVAVHAAVVVFVAGVGGVKPVVAVVIAFSS